MSDKLSPEPDVAWKFIHWLNPDGPYHLERMESEGNAAPVAKTYRPDDVGPFKKFVASNNSVDRKRNIYFLPNAEFLSGKRRKANISAARFLYVDLDCKDYPGTEDEQSNKILSLLDQPHERPKGVPEPTAIWYTGGGYQALWRLADPIEPAFAEELNYSLLVALQGDPVTHDSSRLLRLPGTVNWLNDKKREAGREPALSLMLLASNDFQHPTSYTPADFTMKLRKPGSVSTGSSGQKSLAEITVEPLPLPQDLSEILPSDPKWVEVIATGDNPPDKHYPSRSELVFASAIWMLANRVDAGYVLSVLIEPDLGISAHVRAQSNPLTYARRQIVQAGAYLEAQRGNWPVVDKFQLPINNNAENVRFALATLGVRTQRNTFTHTDNIEGHQLEGRDLNDVGEILSSTFQRELNFNASPAAVKRELITLAHENQYHPVIDYFDGLEWDGVERLDTWLIDHIGAEDTELMRTFGRLLLIAGVRRIKKPGVKFDTMLVLEGAQGAGKSRLAAKLAVRPEWFCDSLDLHSDDKTKAEILQRAWIVECQELDGMNKATSQKLKKFLSSPSDTYRKAYGRDASEYPRHCIIIGTTNEDTYLRDLSGNRRFWPVRIGKIDLDSFAEAIDQLWAEAVVREAMGESITLPQHLWADAANAQIVRMMEDPFSDILEATFADKKGRISMETIKSILGVETSRMTPYESRRIKSIMAGIGWDFGSHRLFDLAGVERAPRKGFACGTSEERKAEYVLSRMPNGEYRVVLFDDEETKYPF